MNMKKELPNKPSASTPFSHRAERRDIVFARSDISCLRGIDQRLASAVFANCNIKLKMRNQ